jgi:hypothetical protein
LGEWSIQGAIHCLCYGVSLNWYEQGLEFYNLVGFHVRSADDSDQVLCHIQLWTAGVGVSAGFHNHTGETFCEIHACIVNGTGKGGMSWATVPDGQFDPANPDPQKYDTVIVGDLHEHGPLWRTSRDGIPERRINGTVDYPWHGEVLWCNFCFSLS